jgi:hypothetical protein
MNALVNGASDNINRAPDDIKPKENEILDRLLRLPMGHHYLIIYP